MPFASQATKKVERFSKVLRKLASKELGGLTLLVSGRHNGFRQSDVVFIFACVWTCNPYMLPTRWHGFLLANSFLPILYNWELPFIATSLNSFTQPSSCPSKFFEHLCQTSLLLPHVKDYINTTILGDCVASGTPHVVIEFNKYIFPCPPFPSSMFLCAFS